VIDFLQELRKSVNERDLNGYEIKNPSRKSIEKLRDYYLSKSIVVPGAFFEILKILGTDTYYHNLITGLSFSTHRSVESFFGIKSMASATESNSTIYPVFYRNLVDFAMDGASGYFFFFSDESVFDPLVYVWYEEEEVIFLNLSMTEFVYRYMQNPSKTILEYGIKLSSMYPNF
jgi:hypothetical protein